MTTIEFFIFLILGCFIALVGFPVWHNNAIDFGNVGIIFVAVVLVNLILAAKK